MMLLLLLFVANFSWTTVLTVLACVFVTSPAGAAAAAAAGGAAARRVGLLVAESDSLEELAALLPSFSLSCCTSRAVHLLVCAVFSFCRSRFFRQYFFLVCIKTVTVKTRGKHALRKPKAGTTHDDDAADGPQ